MSQIPVTSISLIKAISGDAASARWTEFFRMYEAPMRGFLADKFPTLEADDVIQETMSALVRKLPAYTYSPDDRGHFRNYLMGIVKHKAMDALEKRRRDCAKAERISGDPSFVRGQSDEDGWKRSALEVALAQLLADESVSARNREVFRHVAVNHEPPEAVAADFGITRNLVDQIKLRMVAKLAALVETLVRAD